MSYRIAYYRVSTRDQSIDAQRDAMGGGFDVEYSDEGVSGATLARDRPGLAKLLESIRLGDTLHVYALDRLGRDGLDVQATIKELLDKGAGVHVRGLGEITGGIGKVIVAVLAQIAEMERDRIAERTADGRAKARRELERTGKTHRGKLSLGRLPAHNAAKVKAWRERNEASIAQTAQHFEISKATVKRYCAAA